MAQAVSSDQNMINILTTWYTDEKLENLLFRNSPVAKKINKIKIGGRNYNLSTEHLQDLLEKIDAPIWWVGDSYESQKDGEIAIHSPERGCIATLAVEWEEDKTPIEEGIADAKLMCLAPRLAAELIRLRAWAEDQRKAFTAVNQTLANSIEALQEQIRFTKPLD